MPEGRTIVKRVNGAIQYSDGTIRVGPVRASYPHLTKPYAGKQGGDGRFGIVGLMPKSKDYTEAKNLIRDFIRQMVRENLADKRNPNPEIPKANWFLRDGNDRPDKPEMVGNWTINAGERPKNPPKLRHYEKDPKTGKARVLDEKEADRLIYPGCWVNILIKPWWQDNEYGKKVNAGLVAVQLARTPPGMDDSAFGTGRISDDDVDDSFDPIDDDDSGYDDEDDDDEL